MVDDKDDTPKPKDGFGKTYEFENVFREEVPIINARRRGSKRIAQQGADTAVGAEEQRRTATIEADGVVRAEINLEEEGKGVDGQILLRPNQESSVVGLALSGGGVRSAAFCLGVLQALDKTNVLPKVDYLSTVSGGGYIGCSLTAALESKPGFPFASRLEEDEPPAMQQLRNYSNYLFPRGARHALLRNGSIYARGLAVNVVLVAQVLFAASALTLLFYSLHGTWTHFLVTAVLGLVIFCSGIAWGFVKSFQRQEHVPEYEDRWARAVGWMIVTLFVVAFCELQPFILNAMHAAPNGSVFAIIIGWKNIIAAAFAPVGAAMGYLSNKLGEYLKSTMQSPQWSGPIKAFALKAAIIAGGLILPLVIWIIYLDITNLGLCIDNRECKYIAPHWVADAVNSIVPFPSFRAMLLYVVLAIAGFMVTLMMQPNANSLHPLYRDRLKKAFLFVPEPRLGEDDLPDFTKPLSKICSVCGPYHLINAALNVEASKTANRRGRNADFFIFSPRFVGSKTTSYVRTAEMEEVIPGLSLAAAMATSGAAVSSNMGAQNIKPLTPTLALLNIRLGYWLRNPLVLADAKPQPDLGSVRKRMHEFSRRRNFFANYYFVAEMFGLLSEKYKSIYLTDGGHIENLGIYELLRRRCRVIIAVDAEADPQMGFGSFNILERYALIDMGIRIDLPWHRSPMRVC
jgi:patatin-like phospholipase